MTLFWSCNAKTKATPFYKPCTDIYIDINLFYKMHFARRLSDADSIKYLIYSDYNRFSDKEKYSDSNIHHRCIHPSFASITLRINVSFHNLITTVGSRSGLTEVRKLHCNFVPKPRSPTQHHLRRAASGPR